MEPTIDPAVFVVVPFALCLIAVFLYEREQRGWAVLSTLLTTVAIGLLWSLLQLECQDSFTERCDYVDSHQFWFVIAAAAPIASPVGASFGRWSGYATLALAPLSMVFYAIGYGGHSPAG